MWRLRRSMRQVVRAGDKLFVDYASQSVPYGRDGDRAQIFVAALGASHYTFACATAHQRLIEWTGAPVRALVLDDWALQPLEPYGREDLLEIMDDRAERHATVITAQLPIEHWHGWIADATIADAILDRLLHSSSHPQGRVAAQGRQGP